ncbi:MAG: zinc ribbon domain-containing protein [Desulfohalobiaceae bacterium]|nr:zinc ribbon domain-containing protein [Desulfohalobiaceae bacterium]
MPIYEYSCSNCSHIFEEWQKDFADREVECPDCGAASKRLISNTAFILKGSGWYVTDYAEGSKKNGDQETAKTTAKSNGDQKVEKGNDAASSGNGDKKQDQPATEKVQSGKQTGGSTESKPKTEPR